MTLTPETYLKSVGIELTATQLLSFIEGYMRSPNLCDIMESYHKAKLMELDMKIMPKSDSDSIIDIEYMRQELTKKGYQWQEHFFNDSHPNNCMIVVAKNNDPSIFTKNPLGEAHFGRLPKEKVCQEILLWLGRQ